MLPGRNAQDHDPPGLDGTKSFTLAHEIIKPDGRIAIDGRCTSVIMDLAGRTIVPVPECLSAHLPKRGRSRRRH